MDTEPTPDLEEVEEQTLKAVLQDMKYEDMMDKLTDGVLLYSGVHVGMFLFEKVEDTAGFINDMVKGASYAEPIVMAMSPLTWFKIYGFPRMIAGRDK